MLQFHQDKQSFTVSFKGKKLLEHTPEQPLIAVGKGQATYEMHYGNFDIEEKLEQKMPLPEFLLVEEKSEQVELKLSYGQDLQVEIKLTVVAGRLEVAFKNPSPQLNRCWLNVLATKDEAIFGCGEQFSEVNLRGKNVPLWVSEQGVGRNKKDLVTFYADADHHAGGDWYTTYYPQPTYISSDNYFCHVEDTNYMEFDFRQDNLHQLYIRAIPAKLVFGVQNSLVAVIQDLTGYLGRQPELPEWTYNGVWLGVQGGSETVAKKLETAKKHGVKVGALWAQDWEGRRVTWFGKQLFWNWQYSKDFYPDLPQLIQKLEQDNIKFMGYINCFLDIEGDMYKEASAKGYVVKNQAGEDYHVVVTAFPAGIVDLTNPAAVEWIKGVIKENMIGIGLAGWMCDFGEYLPTDAVLYSGESAESYHNKYPAMWAKANREAVEEAGKLDQVTFFTRAGYSETGRYSTIMWAGDQLVNWSLDDGLASVIPAALSLGMSGFGLFHSDTGGYTSLFDVIRTKEVFMRWAEMSAFMPVMRTHEGNRPDENWQFDSDEETLHHFAKMTSIYVALKPYFQEIVAENAQTGVPCLRMPFIHYQDEAELIEYKYQFLLGRDVLVAPIYLEGETTREVYLPDDQWVHLWTGDTYGQGLHVVEAPMGQMPVFYRQGSKFVELFARLNTL